MNVIALSRRRIVHVHARVQTPTRTPHECKRILAAAKGVPYHSRRTGPTSYGGGMRQATHMGGSAVVVDSAVAEHHRAINDGEACTLQPHRDSGQLPAYFPARGSQPMSGLTVGGHARILQSCRQTHSRRDSQRHRIRQVPHQCHRSGGSR